MIAQPEHQQVNSATLARSEDKAKVCRDAGRGREGASPPSAQPVLELASPRPRCGKRMREFARNRVCGRGEVRVLREGKAQFG